MRDLLPAGKRRLRAGQLKAIEPTTQRIAAMTQHCRAALEVRANLAASTGAGDALR
jgi:hypothetical protein